jgi:hypothetical protein
MYNPAPYPSSIFWAALRNPFLNLRFGNGQKIFNRHLPEKFGDGDTGGNRNQ